MELRSDTAMDFADVRGKRPPQYSRMVLAAVVEDIWVRTEHGEGDIGFFGKRMVLGQENMELVAAKTVEFQIEALKLMLNKLCVGIIVGYKAKLTPTGCHILNDIADFSLLKTDKIVVFLQ